MCLMIPYNFIVHAQNQHDQKQRQLVHMPPSITCGIWFHGSYNQMNVNRNGEIYVSTPTVLLENGSMVPNQTNADRNGNY